MIIILAGTSKSYTMGSRVNDEINNERFRLMEENNINIDILFDKYKQADNLVGGPYQKNAILMAKKNSYLLSKDNNIEPIEGVIIINDYMELVNKYKDNKEEDLYVVGGKIVFDLFTPHASKLYIMEPTIELPGELIYDSYTNEEEFELVNEESHTNMRFLEYNRK